MMIHTTQLFQSSTLMGGAVWFKTHKLAMISTLVLSVLGMVPVLIDRKLDPIKRMEYHPMVGLAVIVICLCQTVIAFFRPGKVTILKQSIKKPMSNFFNCSIELLQTV